MKKMIKTLFCSLCCVVIINTMFFYAFSTSTYATSKKTNQSVLQDTTDPYIILSAYSVSDDEIITGQKFELKLIIKNTHETKTAKSVTIDVSCSNGIIPVYPTVTQEYIGDVLPNEEKEITFSYTASSAYSEDFAYFSVYIQNEKNDNSVVISAPVKSGNSAFSILSVSIPKSAIAGETISTSVHFKSLIADKVSNVSMYVYLDDVELVNSSIGNLHGGASKTQNVSYAIHETGKHNITYELEWMDNAGKMQTIEVYSENIDVTDAINENVVTTENSSVIDRFSERELIVMCGCIGLSFLLLICIVIIILKNNKGGKR